MQVSIILLNYNGKQFNKACIDSILKQSYQDFEIVFVDNVSTDGSVEEVESLYTKQIAEKKIKIIRNTKNTGFTWGNNLWVQHADKTSKYICLLNNDTIVPNNRLEELIKWIESDNTLWAVGSMILDKGYEEEIKKDYLINHETFVLTTLGETAKEKVSDKEASTGIYYTSSISWCCFFYKKNIIERPFPEFYFAYGEDVWLSLFMMSTWWKMAICTKSIVHHYGSWSFGKKPSNLKLFYGNRNQIINFLVYYRNWTKIKLLPLFTITQFAHICINVPWKRFKAKINARIWIIRNWWKIKEIRKKIDKERKMNDKKIIKKLSYKFSDDVYRIWWKNKNRIIKIVNTIFRHYINLFF